MASPKKQKPKISKHPNSGQYVVSCGKHYDVNGLLRRTDFYLGLNEDEALVKQAVIRRSWSLAKKEGHKVWHADLLQVLIDHKIISPTTAKTICELAKEGTAQGTITNLKAKVEELSKFADAKGVVQLDALPQFVTTIFKQELTDDDMLIRIRQAVKKLGQEQPLQAVRLALDFWQMTKTQEQQPAVTLNLGTMLALDDSEARAVKVRQIIEDTGVIDAGMGDNGAGVDQQQPDVESGDNQRSDGIT